MKINYKIKEWPYKGCKFRIDPKKLRSLSNRSQSFWENNIFIFEKYEEGQIFILYQGRIERPGGAKLDNIIPA